MEDIAVFALSAAAESGEEGKSMTSGKAAGLRSANSSSAGRGGNSYSAGSSENRDHQRDAVGEMKPSATSFKTALAKVVDGSGTNISAWARDVDHGDKLDTEPNPEQTRSSAHVLGKPRKIHSEDGSVVLRVLYGRATGKVE